MLLLALAACRPYQPPPEPPALDAAQEVRVIPTEGRRIAVRAGSAFDPPGREGLAWVAARIVAMRIDAEVEVGREVVELRLRGNPDGLPRIWAPVTEAELHAVAQAPERDCAGQAEDAYAAWAWAGHPYGHPIWGRTSTLPTLRAVEVDSFLTTWWVRSAMLSSEVMPALAMAPARLNRAPVPAFPPPLPVEPVLRVRGVSSCVAVGGGNVDARPTWPLFTDAAPPVVSEGMYVATLPLPDGARGEARVRDELLAWADAPPPIAPVGASWAGALIPAGLVGAPRPVASAAQALARWFGDGQLRMVVVLPDATAPAELPSVATLVR